MKPVLLCGLLLAGLLTHSAPASAQAPTPFAAGYWTLETNRTARYYTVARFYSPQHTLLYEEQLPGLCLDLSRANRHSRRTARRLDATLQQVMHDPAARQTGQLLAQNLRQDRRVLRVYAVR